MDGYPFRRLDYRMGYVNEAEPSSKLNLSSYIEWTLSVARRIDVPITL